jgi:UDP-galactopyranose mutase
MSNNKCIEVLTRLHSKFGFKWIDEQVKIRFPNIHFLGRLGSYKYMDMDASVGQALHLVKKFS